MQTKLASSLEIFRDEIIECKLEKYEKDIRDYKKGKIHNWLKKLKLQTGDNYQSHGCPQAQFTHLMLSSEDQQSTQSDTDCESVPI